MITATCAWGWAQPGLRGCGLVSTEVKGSLGPSKISDEVGRYILSLIWTGNHWNPSPRVEWREKRDKNTGARSGTRLLKKCGVFWTRDFVLGYLDLVPENSFASVGKEGWLPDSLKTWDSGLLGLREEAGSLDSWIQKSWVPHSPF